MNHKIIAAELSKNSTVFKDLFSGLVPEIYLWKPNADKWCLLEILCHLCDEEQEDFRTRTKHVLDTPALPLPSINPTGWVLERNYMKQNPDDKLDQFLTERKKSVEWLNSLQAPEWNNAYEHPKFGPMTAKMLLANWLAHDYLHIRQMIKVKYDYLKQLSNEGLNYAGDW